MKLVVQGIEEIELTDPQGLCQLSVLPPLPQPGQGYPIPTGNYPTPQIPTPAIPGGWGDPTIKPTHKPPIYTRHDYYSNDPDSAAKWGIGGPMIQQASDPKDPDKWEKNWRANMNGEEGQKDGNGNYSL